MSKGQLHARRISLVLTAITVLMLVNAVVEAKTTLEFWHSWGTSEDFLATIERFHQQYPDIVIKETPLATSGRASKVLAAMVSNTAPDVLMATRAEVIQFADAGIILPIDTQIQQARINLGRFYKAELDAFRWDRKLWALPMPTVGGNESLIFYNKDIFAELGMNPDVAPKTWRDIEALAKKANRWEGGQLTRFGFDVASYNRFNALLYSNNGDFISEDGKKATFGSEEGRYALEWMRQFTNEVNGGLEGIQAFQKSGGLSARFYEGKLAAMYSGVSIFPKLLEDKFNFGVGLIPYNSDNPKAAHRGVAGRLYGWGYVMPTSINSAKQAAAFEFIKFLTTEPAGGCQFLKASARPSSLRDCNADRSYFQANPYWGLVGQALELDVAYPMTPIDANLQPAINTAVTQVVTNKLAPKAAIDTAVAQVQAMLDAFWSTKKPK